MRSKSDQIVVLMATYNGEQFIKDQIESILGQTYENILLIISDDASTDKTREIIERYTECNSNIQLLPVKKSGSARANFQNLITYALQNTDNQYYMFADQDDIWFEDKVEIELQTIKKVEKKLNSKDPVLVYGNYYDFYGIKTEEKIRVYDEPKINSFSRIVLQSWLMGCTMILNRSLLEICHTIPIEADNHDAWVAMIASLVGEIKYIETPLMMHRIHANNVTQQLDTTNMISRLSRTIIRINMRKAYREKMQRLLEKLKIAVAGRKHDEYILTEFERLLKEKGIKAILTMNKNQFWGVNKLQRILFMIQFAIK